MVVQMVTPKKTATNTNTRTHQRHGQAEEDASGYEERPVGAVRGAGGRQVLRWRQDSLWGKVSRSAATPPLASPLHLIILL